MFSSHLDTPPPISQFRRPWSPDPNDPFPAVNDTLPRDTRFANYDDHNYDYDQPRYSYRERREPSDVSVEALDLADYARTLRPATVNPNDQYYHSHDMYPPLSPPLRPLSRESAATPSLTSHGETHSSNSHSSRPRYPTRRPFSLPPSTGSTRTISALSHRYPAFADPRIYAPTDPEIDISQFPAWSRNWYNTNSSPPAEDIYTALPKPYFTSKRSPFDPGYKYNSYAPTTTYANNSSRDMLPWSSDPPEHGPSVDDDLKQERIRMLEREFGSDAHVNRKTDPFLDENGKPVVGSVDSKGQLVTQGPKKRLAARILQIIFASAAAIPGIYAALVIKPQGRPPPSGTIAAYVLYVVSVITLVALLGLFVFRPCCCRPRVKVGGPSNPLANGMMVLPVQGPPGGKKAQPKGGKKGKNGQQTGDVQVNLIVDPTVFSGGQEEESEEEEEGGDWEGSMPGGFETNRRKRRRKPRRSIFAGLAMEEQWRRARAWTKKITAVDVFGAIIWGAVFVLILIGPRCPIGGFDGWCNAYNTSSAAACLLCITFAISIFFDVKDLHTSKVSPRTRT